MIQPSSISSNHHYYTFFFQSEDVNDIKDIFKILEIGRGNIEKMETSLHVQLFHTQKSIPKAYGSLSVLDKNKIKKDSGGLQYYFYDFYIGTFQYLKEQMFFLSYPYKALDSYLKKKYPLLFSKIWIYKPDVETVLNHIRSRPYLINNQRNKDENEITVDIIKYSAEIKEEDSLNAKSLNLVGENPVNSKVYELLNTSDEVSISPLSLKLRCSLSQVGNLELLFDRFGNHRYWIPKNKQIIKTSLLSETFIFFDRIKAVNKEEYLSNHTALENDD